MSQEKQKKKFEECGKKTEITRLEIQLLKDEKNIELNDIHGITKTENDEESLIPDIIENFQQEIITDNFDDKPKPLLNLEGIEKCLSEVKEKKEEDLDIYIEDVISILEEFSCILNFEELIDDPNYTFKLFMNSLKRVINFNYFHQKFIVPNVKTKENNGQTYNEKKGIKNGKNMSGDDSRKNKINKKEKRNQNEKDKDINKIRKSEEETFNIVQEKNKKNIENKKKGGKKQKEETEQNEEGDWQKEEYEKEKEENDKKEEEKQDEKIEKTIKEDTYDIEQVIEQKGEKEFDKKEKEIEQKEGENQIEEKEKRKQKEIEQEKVKKGEENQLEKKEEEQIKKEHKCDEKNKQPKKKEEQKKELIHKQSNSKKKNNKEINEIKNEKYKEKENLNMINIINDFLNKLNERGSKRFSNQENSLYFEENNNGDILMDQSIEKSKNIISLSEDINTSSNIDIIKKNSTINTIKDDTSLKLEEYKIMNYDNILSIIGNNANIEEEEYIDGKNYESKAKKYFKIVLDICSKKSYYVYSNPAKSIQGFYKFYEDLVQQDKIKINKNITGDSKQKIEYNKIEFDLMVNDVSAKVIKKMIKIFKSSIIAKNFNENIKDSTKYQIIGEIAKNILNQSIDKNKQIGKIIDVLLIEEYLTTNEISKKENKYVNNVLLNYIDLRLNFLQKKFIFIFTDGSFIELKKALLFTENDFEKEKIDYEKLNINSIYPIINKNRYGKNILYLQKIIGKLNRAKIPYIIFYIGEEINNGREKIMINHIKKSRKKSKYKSILNKIIKNEEQISKNIFQSYLLRNINKSLKMVNKNKIFKIIKDINQTVPDKLIQKYCNLLFENLIEKNENIERNNILVISMIPKEDLSLFETTIDTYNKGIHFVNIKLIYLDDDKILNKILEEYNEKKFFEKYLITCNDGEDIGINYMLDLIVIDQSNPLSIISQIQNKNFSKLNNILKNYILSHFLYFKEDKYMDFGTLYKKIIYDVNNLSKIIPIKNKEIKNDKIFFGIKDKIQNIIFAKNIIDNKSNEIIKEIKECIGNKLYEYIIGNKEEKMKEKMNNNLKIILEHIMCFYIYEQFFTKYIPLKLS